MSVVYYLSVSLFLVFVYALAANVSGLNDLGIEGEYMPPEIVTRICYILIVALCVPMWVDARGREGIVISPAGWADELMPKIVPSGVFVSAVLMLFMENNWDLWLRESFAGTLMFAIPFLLLFLPLLWRAVVRHRTAAIILTLGLIILAGGEVMDLTEGGSVLSEELIELLSAILVLHAIIIVAVKEGKAATRRAYRVRRRIGCSAVVLSIGNAMLLFDHGDVPPIWQLVAGSVISIIGFYLVYRSAGMTTTRYPPSGTRSKRGTQKRKGKG